jgi:hypothetical protein
VPESRGRLLDQVRQFGFIALYALMLLGVSEPDHHAAPRFLLQAAAAVNHASSRDAPDRKAPPRPSRRRTQNWASLQGSTTASTSWPTGTP